MSSFFTKMTGATGFPIFSRTWDCDAGIPDLTGKVAIVTGGNTGIGYMTTRELLKHNAKVYIACRTASRAEDAIKRLEEEVPEAKGRVVFLQFDLTDLKSAEEAVRVFESKETRLDIMIANAGVMAWPLEIINGIEVQFWNHLGHYALIQPLLPLMIKTSEEPDSHVRIINVSSVGHNMTPRPDFTSLETINAPLRNTWARYGQSKLANVLYTVSLQSRLASTSIRVLSLHPGNVHTELTRGPVVSFGWFGRLMMFLSGYLAMTALEGAKTQLWAATSSEVDTLDLKGEYILPIATVAKASAYGQDKDLAEELWRFSEMAVKKLS